MHATIEQLLNYRDGHLLEAKWHAHIQQCKQCSEEVEKLSEINSDLNSLAVSELSSEDLDKSWDAISMQLIAQKNSQKPQNIYWMSAAACALIIGVVIGFKAYNQPLDFPQDYQVAQSSPDSLIQDEKALDTQYQSLDSNTENELAQLVAYSRLLESQLQAMPQPRVIRANTAGTISQLQDQISVLDSRLNLDHQIPLTEQQRNALWQQRVNSMNNLYRVRSAQLQRVSY